MRLLCSVVMLILMPQIALAWESLVYEICPSLGVPAELAMAIIEHESSGNPYALGVTIARAGGRGYIHSGYYPSDYFAATVLLRQALSYTKNVGIGLMQVTWSVHGHRLKMEPYELLDAQTNITEGCKILASELSGPGDIVERIGRYHSHTPRLRDAYGKAILSGIRRLSNETITASN